MATVTLRLTPQRAHVRTARLVATAMARRSGVSEEFLDEIRLAVGEACGRAVQLHERYGLAELVVVTLIDDDNRFEIVVRDAAPSKPGYDAAISAAVGTPVEAGGAPGPQAGAGADAAAIPDWEAPLDAGLGLALLDALVEDISIDMADGMAGTEVRMSWPVAGSGRPAGPPPAGR